MNVSTLLPVPNKWKYNTINSGMSTKLDNLDEMCKFLKTQNLNRPITQTLTQLSKIFQQIKSLDLMTSLLNSII